MMIIKKLIATGGGLGYIPIAPGTVGALGGWVISIWIKSNFTLPDFWLAALIVFFTILGIWTSNYMEKEWGKDPNKVVIDEIVGIWISVLFLPHNWLLFIAAFILFRFFDIVKPLYISYAENIKGGWGIMADDILAGIYTNLTVQVTYFIYTCFI